MAELHNLKYRLLCSIAVTRDIINTLFNKIVVEVTGRQSGDAALADLLQGSSKKKIEKIPALKWESNKHLWLDQSTNQVKTNITIQTARLDMTLLIQILLNVSKLQNIFIRPQPHATSCTIHIFKTRGKPNTCIPCHHLYQFIIFAQDLRNFLCHHLQNNFYDDFEAGKVVILGNATPIDLIKVIEQHHKNAVYYLTDNTILSSPISVDDGNKLLEKMDKIHNGDIDFLKEQHLTVVINTLESIMSYIDGREKFLLRIRIDFKLPWKSQRFLSRFSSFFSCFSSPALSDSDVEENSKLSTELRSYIKDEIRNLMGAAAYDNSQCKLSQENADLTQTVIVKSTQVKFHVKFEAQGELDPDLLHPETNSAKSLKFNIKKRITDELTKKYKTPVKVYLMGYSPGSILISLVVMKESNKPWRREEVLILSSNVRAILEEIAQEMWMHVRVRTSWQERILPHFTYTYMLTMRNPTYADVIREEISSLEGKIVGDNKVVRAYVLPDDDDDDDDISSGADHQMPRINQSATSKFCSSVLTSLHKLIWDMETFIPLFIMLSKAYIPFNFVIMPWVVVIIGLKIAFFYRTQLSPTRHFRSANNDTEFILLLYSCFIAIALLLHCYCYGHLVNASNIYVALVCLYAWKIMDETRIMDDGRRRMDDPRIIHRFRNLQDVKSNFLAILAKSNNILVLASCAFSDKIYLIIQILVPVSILLYTNGFQVRSTFLYHDSLQRKFLILYLCIAICALYTIVYY